jgi:hypothetical protein
MHKKPHTPARPVRQSSRQVIPRNHAQLETSRCEPRLVFIVAVSGLWALIMSIPSCQHSTFKDCLE